MFLKLTEQDFRIDSRSKQCNKFRMGTGRKLNVCLRKRQETHRNMYASATIHIVANVNEGGLNLKIVPWFSGKEELLRFWARRRRHFCKYCHSVWISLRCSSCAFGLHLPRIDCAIQWRWFNGNMMWISKWRSMWDTWLWMCYTLYRCHNINMQCVCVSRF